MLILYVALKYDYGNPLQGYSFEHYNFYDSLLKMGHDVICFDFGSLINELGREAMNKRLLQVVNERRPDLLFCILFRDELQQETLREISRKKSITTLNWFCDDHWRFDNFSRHWAPCFNWVVTTAKSALPKYKEIGYDNVIKSQWACNHFLYRKMEVPLEYDLTFVGQPHGNRREIVQSVRDAGIDIRAWGNGWESGRLSQEDMLRVFNQSRVNLNLSNSSVPRAEVESQSVGGTLRHFARKVDTLPLGSQAVRAAKRWLPQSLYTKAPAVQTQTNSDADGKQFLEQIKGRNFEVPGCGGFMLTGRAENLEAYYEDGKEIVCFKDTNDLIEKAKYYLHHENERAAIADAGYQRTLSEHTYVHRFTKIFDVIGLPSEPAEKILQGGVRPGRCVEVD